MEAVDYISLIQNSTHSMCLCPDCSGDGQRYYIKHRLFSVSKAEYARSNDKESVEACESCDGAGKFRLDAV